MHGIGEASRETQVALSHGVKAALLGCGLFTTIGLFSVGLVLPQIEVAFASTPGSSLLIQLIGGVASFAFALASPFAGMLIDRFGCRHVLMPSLILFAAAGAAPALLDSLWTILAMRVMLGLALACIFTAGLTGIGGLPVAVRARMFGWYSVVGGAAAVLLFPLIGALAVHGWRLPFAVNLVSLPILPLALLLPRDLGLTVKAGVDRATDVSAPLLNGGMLLLLVLAAFAGMAMFIGPIYSPLYLASLGVTDTKLMAVPITMAAIAAVFASAGYGALHRRLGVAGVTTLTMILIGVGLLLSGTAGVIPLFAAGVVLTGASVAVFAPNVSAAAVELSGGRNPARALGVANGAMFGAQLLFPFIAAWIARSFGPAGVFMAFGLCALLIGVAFVLRMLLMDKPRQVNVVGG